MRNAYRLILGFGIIALTLLSPQIAKTEQRLVKNQPITDNILRSKIAFAVVNEAIARGLNLHTLSESDSWKLRGPVLLDPQADIHFQLREEFDRIVNTVDFGAALNAGSPSQNAPISPGDKPVLYQKAAEIIRDFIAQKHISVIIMSDAPIGMGEIAAIRGLRGEVRYTYEIINSASVSVPLKNIAALIKLPFITEIWPNSKGSFKLSDSVQVIGADEVHNAPPNGLGVTGQGVTVAVVDNGIYNDHPEFKGRIEDSREWVFDGPGEAEKHGTHVAGIIGAADDGVGVTGVAPEVSFLDASVSINILDALDCLYEESYCEAMDAIGWAARKRFINTGRGPKIINNANTKADIINMSAGFDSWRYGREGDDPMSKLIDEVVEDYDIVFVVSAGNEAFGHISAILPAKTSEVDHAFGKIRGAFHVVLVQDSGASDLDLEIYVNTDGELGKLLCAEYSGWNILSTSTERGSSYYGISKDYTKVKCNNRDQTFEYIVRVKRNSNNTTNMDEKYELWLSLGGDFKNNHHRYTKDSLNDTLAVPGYSKKAITVGAIMGYVGSDYKIWVNSSRGPNTSNQPLKPEVVAPGGLQIKSTVPEDEYGWEWGTSMAAAHVSGVAALILDAVGKNSAGEWNFSPDEVKSAIVRGAENLTGQPPDNEYGAGLVKADNIIFGGTVKPGKKLRFQITPRLVKDRYNNLDLDPKNVFAAAISWGDNEEVFPPPTPGTTIPPTQGTATRDLDLEFLDQNRTSLTPFHFHTFASGSNYVKVGHDNPNAFGTFFYLDVVHKDPNGKPIRFTGASTQPIKPLVVVIPSKVGPTRPTTTAPPQGTSVLNLPEDAKARFGKGNIHHIAYSPDGTLLATAGRAGVWLYDAETYQAVGYLKGHMSGVSTLAFSPDGRTLATGNRLYGGNTAHLWDVDTRTEKNTLTTGYLHDVAFSPDGKTIATTDDRDEVRLWDVETGTEKTPLTISSVEKIAFSPDGKTIATTDGGALVRLWSVSFGVEMKVFTGYNGGIHSIAFSPDGKTIAGGGSDNTVRLWDVDTGETKHRLRGHTREVRSITFSPDGKTIATGSTDNTVRLWDVKTGETKHTLTGDRVLAYNSYEYPDVTFSSDGKTIASVDLDFTVRLWDVKTGTEKKTLTGHTSEVHSVAFSPDGNTLASGVMDQTDKNITVRLWDVKTGAKKNTLTGHKYLVYGVAFSPDGNTLATAGDDTTVRLWDAETGAEKNTLTDHQFPVSSVAFSPDGKIFASGGGGNNYGTAGTVHLWDVETGENKQTITHHEGHVHSVAFSPDGNTLAIGGQRIRGGTVLLWDIETGENKQTITLPGYSIEFSPDGKTIATASGSSAHLWNLAFDEIKHTFTGPTDTYYGPPPVYSVAFSPDGNTLATGGGTPTGGGAVHLWDVKTGENKHTLTGHTAPVRSVAFNSDGSTLASGSEDGTVLLWDVTPYTVEPPAPEYPPWDVNRDGQINIVDVVSVSHYIGEPASASPRADVNGDGIINILDLLLVSKHMDESTDAAAPASIATLEGLDRTTVEGWLALARIEDDGSLLFQQGIAYLERLLAVLTPKETALLANYPNPFNPETWIPYQLAKPTDVTLTIHDIQGRVVRNLELGHQPVGIYQDKSRAAYWDGKNAQGESVASGVYFYTLTAGDFTATRKLLIRK